MIIYNGEWDLFQQQSKHSIDNELNNDRELINNLRLFTTYRSNKIQAEAIRAPKLRIKPAKNQILAPMCPRQPPSETSPLTWLLETEFILLTNI